jgi:putative PEP-CTERM system TPR-repeat lipoprotein
LGIALSLIAASGCTRNPAQLFESARASHAEGNISAAVIHLKSALQDEPNNAEMRYFLGRIYNEMFDGASAEKELMRAREAGLVSGGRVEAELAVSLRLQGKPERLLSTIKPSQAFEPEVLALIHAMRGDAQFFLRQIDAAKRSYAAAKELAPSIPEVELLAARLRLSEGDWKAAVEATEQVVQAHPRHIQAHTLSAELFMLGGKEEEALAAYGHILALQPNQLGALVSRSTLLVKMGRLDEAQKDVDVLRRAYPSLPVSLHQQALVYYQRKEYRQALDMLQTVQRSSPDFLPAMLLTGMVHYRLGSYSQSEQVLSRYLAANPSNVFARRELAKVLLQLRQSTRALEILEPLLRGDRVHPSVYALAGDVYSQLGQFGRAGELLQRASAVSPDHPDILARQALVNFRAGADDRAIEQLEKATTLSTSVSKSDGMLLHAYLFRKEFAKAQKLVASLEAEAPKDPRTFYFKGVVLLEMRQEEDAKRAFEKALELQSTFVPAVERLVQMDLAAGAVDIARRRYETVLVADKTNLEALLGIASLQRRTGQRKESVDTLERAAASNPLSIEPRARLVDIYLRQGDTSRAHATAEGALLANPNHPAAMELVGAVQLARGETNSALRTFSSLVSSYPNSEKAHYALGQAQTAAGLTKEAESSLRKSVELNKEFIAPQLKLMSLLVEKKRYEEALQFARKLQKDMPQATNGLVFEGEVHAAQGKYHEAAKLFRAALAKQFADKVAMRLYQVQVKAGSADDALLELKRNTEKNPNALESRTALADALLARRNFSAAAVEYEAIRQFLPRHPLILNNLAWAYWNLKDRRGRELAEEAYKLAPDNPITADTLGWILLQSGELKRGLGLMEQAVTKAPEIPVLRYHYAVALVESGQRSRAKEQLQHIVGKGLQFGELKQAEALLMRLN